MTDLYEWPKKKKKIKQNNTNSWQRYRATEKACSVSENIK